MTKQIIAAGGDALTDIPLHYYLFAQSEKVKPKICFLPTASGDDAGIVKSFFSMFGRYPHCEPDYLPLFHNKEANIREFILSQDIILVGGGHSKSMIGVWKEWDLDKILLEAYEKGIILAGGSAGSVCWHASAITDSFPGELRPMDFLNFLPYSNCPHYRAEERRRAYKSAILEKRIKPGYAIGDGAAIHYKDGKFFRAIASDAEASCFYVDINDKGKEEKIQSERLKTYWLNDKKVQEELIWGAPCFDYLNQSESTASSE